MAMAEESSQISQEVKEMSRLDLLAIIFLHCGRPDTNAFQGLGVADAGRIDVVALRV